MADPGRLASGQTGFHSTILCFAITTQECLPVLSPQATNLLGYAPDELAGMQVVDFFSEDETQSIESIIDEARTGSARHWGCFQLRKKSGELLPVTLATACYPGAGASCPASLIAVHSEELPFETHALRYAGAGDVERVRQQYDLIRYCELQEEELDLHFGLYDDPDEPHTVAAERLTSEFIGKLLPLDGKRVLDLGCGTGRCATMLAREHRCRVDAVTVSPEQHRVATARARALQVDDRARFLLADANRVDFATQAYDVVYALESICHMDRDRIIGQAYRALKPGGLFSFCDLYPLQGGIFHLRSGVLTFVSIHQNLRGLRKHGFRDIRVTDWTDRVAPNFRRVDGYYDQVAVWALTQGITAEQACRRVEAAAAVQLSEFRKERIAQAIAARRCGTSLVERAIHELGYCDFVASKEARVESQPLAPHRMW